MQGQISPGYESVRDMFKAGFDNGREVSAQLCVYVGDKMVISLWHSNKNDAYTNNTLTAIFSCSKNLSSLALAMLHDRGLLRYDARVEEYWPEFTGEGKEAITVADIMRHEAGYARFPIEFNSIELLCVENIKKNSIGILYEGTTPSYPKKGKREYHGATRGFLTNELFRRIEPSGCTIGEFVRREITNKLTIRVFIGVTEEELEDYEPVKAEGIISSGFTAVSTLPFNIWPIYIAEVVSRTTQFTLGEKKFDFTSVEDLINDDSVRKAEIPSANGNASAEGLAKLAAFLANKGQLGSERILSEKSWLAMHAGVTDSGLLGDKFMTHYSQGGVNRYESDDDLLCCGRDGFWGWMGYGGSVFQWHPELKIGFAYLPTFLEWSDKTNSRGGLLQNEVVKCVNRISVDSDNL